MPNEADTCRRYVVPKLQAAGWDDEPYRLREQVTFTDGRIVVVGREGRRRPGKRADYLLCYRPDVTLAVVEAKPTYRTAGAGLQQAKEYAEILGLRFAYGTNGHGIVEFDYFTGQEREIETFPTPEELWERYATRQQFEADEALHLLTPSYNVPGKTLRYYQEIAVNRAIQAILQDQRRVLLTMATGTGKTFVAFQICWKLWSSRWNRTGEHRRPRILYLADRNILIDDPMAKEFSAFGDARHKIANGEAIKSREMYFAIYQSIAKDERRPGLYREYAPDFFDLVIVDECHRGSARDESNWREILEYFDPAFQIGMTATPRRQDNADTYRYFGNPVFTYSLRQGIDDGFLAPYRVHRVITEWDAAGWRPSQGDLDRYGRVGVVEVVPPVLLAAVGSHVPLVKGICELTGEVDVRPVGCGVGRQARPSHGTRSPYDGGLPCIRTKSQTSWTFSPVPWAWSTSYSAGSVGRQGATPSRTTAHLSPTPGCFQRTRAAPCWREASFATLSSSTSAYVCVSSVTSTFTGVRPWM